MRGMDLLYALLNVLSKLSPGLQHIHQPGTAFPAMREPSEPGQHPLLSSGLPRAGLWTPSSRAPHPDTWGEEE